MGQKLLCGPALGGHHVPSDTTSVEFSGTAGEAEAGQTPKTAESQPTRNALCPSSAADSWNAEGLVL